jgi:diadenosine tetraphosphate (Ap4A) HIT family hydrolase
MHWKSPDEWRQMKSGLDCQVCADIHLEVNAFSYLVAEFEHTYVRLPKNQYMPGWTIVFLKRHANELFELTETELLGFWRDVARVARALDQLYQPAKINYAVYGNLNPHVHCHLVLQHFTSDPTKPLNMNEQEVLLTDVAYQQSVRELQHALAA